MPLNALSLQSTGRIGIWVFNFAREEQSSRNKGQIYNTGYKEEKQWI